MSAAEAMAPNPTAVAGSEATLPGRLVARAAGDPERTALRHKRLGRWKETSWAGYEEHAARAGLGMLALGIEPGAKIAIQAENRPEWLYADLGAQGIGAVTVGIYPTSPEAEVEYLIGHSEARLLIAEDEEQLDKALGVRERLPLLEWIVVIDSRGVGELDDERVITFDELLERGADAEISDWRERVDALDPGETAIIVYTSGTTGPPKGAMVTHANMGAAATAFGEAYEIGERDEVLSYLPLCHIAERLVSLIDAVRAGYIVNFGEGPEAFSEDLRQVQPTFFLGVPRVWEKMLAGVEVRIADASFLKRTAWSLSKRLGKPVAERRLSGSYGPFDRVRYRLAWALAFGAVREKLGLRRVKVALSGAAPVAPQVLEFFWMLGVPVREGYGQTENTALATSMPADDVRLGTVGRALPGVELRIAEDGEILTRSEGVFAGYLKNPEASAETVDADGWLSTGDVGTIDDDGFLTITDRKKDIMITAGGKNVSPSEIENRLKVSPFVREAIVVGDGRKYLSALIGIELDTVGDWAGRQGIAYTTYADLTRQGEVRELIDGVVEEANAELARVEQVKRFSLLEVELDPEDGQLTATQKVKRKAISEQFSELIEGMYD